MEQQREPIIDKTTLVKSAERIKFHAKPFANGKYGVEISWAFNPDNSMNIDQFLTYDDPNNTIRQVLTAFIDKVIEGHLGGKVYKHESRNL